MFSMKMPITSNEKETGTYRQIYLAALNNDREEVKRILQAGGNIDIKRKGSKQTVAEALVEKGEDLKVIDNIH